MNVDRPVALQSTKGYLGSAFQNSRWFHAY
mgnify:CR=1 FL=1